MNSSELLVEGSGELGFRIVGTLGARSLWRVRKNISYHITDVTVFDNEIKSIAMSTSLNFGATVTSKGRLVKYNQT